MTYRRLIMVALACAAWMPAAHAQPRGLKERPADARAFATQASGAGPAAAAQKQDCGDFLAQMGRKPPNLTYVGCSFAAEEQGKPLRATYHVPGRFAAAVEAYLRRTVGLLRLKHVCCQWDSRRTQFRDAKGREFLITMFSGETVVTRRRAWSAIETFEIVVETFTEEI